MAIPSPRPGLVATSCDICPPPQHVLQLREAETPRLFEAGLH